MITEATKQAVFRRDGGLCQAVGCGRDLNEVAVRFNEAAHMLASGDPHWAGSNERQRGVMLEIALDRIKKSWGFNAGQRLWQVDHVRPANWKGGNALENLQLLCVPCHKAKTAGQAAQDAMAKRAGKPGPVKYGPENLDRIAAKGLRNLKGKEAV